MPASFTSNLNLALPQVDVDSGWGTTLNSDFVVIDNIFAGNGTGTSVGVNIGNGKTLTMGGTMVLGRGDATNTVTAPAIRGAARTGTNAAGANLTIQAANGTGTGGSGNIIFQTAPVGGSGTVANTFTDALVIDKSTNIGIGVTSPTSRIHARQDSNSLLVMQQLQNRDTGANTSGVIAFINSNNDLSANRYAYIGARTTGSGQNGNFLTFATNADGGAPAERLRISENGSIGIGGANYGTSGQILTSTGSSTAPAWQDNRPLNKFSSQSLSGVADVTFTGIISSAEIVQIVFHKVRRGITSSILIQLGDSGGIETTGYDSYSGISTSTSLSQTSSNGFVVYNTSTASEISGIITLARMYDDLWNCSYTLANTGTGSVISGGGNKFLSADLTTIKIVGSAAGNFTSGNVRVMYLT